EGDPGPPGRHAISVRRTHPDQVDRGGPALRGRPGPVRRRPLLVRRCRVAARPGDGGLSPRGPRAKGRTRGPGPARAVRRGADRLWPELLAHRPGRTGSTT